MAKFLKSLGISAVFAVAGFAGGQAAAMPIGGPGKALERIDLVAKAQYSYGGQNYCWYDDGWNGPGWYVCGQYTVRGVGWGGAAGWHGWTRGGGVRGGTAGRVGGGRTGGHASGRTGGGHAGGRGGGGRTGGGRGGGGRRSDMLLKHDVALLGWLGNGLGFYRFSYNGSDRAYVGVMAQEVQAIAP